MNAGAKMLRSLMLAGILISATAGVVRAAGVDKDPCVNDIDCAATPQCGGEVCDFLATMKCIPANGGGAEGWCTVSTDCKCAGAVCNVGYCSFTTPQASGTAGTSGGTAGSGGSSAGGSGGSSTGTAGAGGTAPKSSSSGGCSVASSTSGGFAALLGLALVAGGLVRRRRRA